jgi:hypothetical protein
MTLARRSLLALPLLLAACGDDPGAPASYPPPSYDYLTKIELKVGRIEIDDSWAPRGAGRRVEFLAPIPPREALRRMAEDRLVAAGTTGRAVFVIEDASIIRGPRDYQASLAVRVDVADDAGNRIAQAPARVVLVRPVRGESERAVRDDLYAFVRELMTEMNVEFEYQVRRTLRDALHQTAPNAPEPGPVEAQPLDGSAPAPAPATPGAPPSDRPDPPVSMSPRPADLGTLPVPRPPGAPTPLAPR